MRYCHIPLTRLFLGLLLTALATPYSRAANPPPTHVYYVPFPEDQQLAAFDAINTVANDPIAVFITLAAATDGTVIYYDHWEDGYEVDITNPVQATTQIFGDGNSSNGYPPGNAGDLIPAGTVFNLRNFVNTSTLQAVIDYDGRDKIAAFKPISVTKTAFPDGTDTLMAGCVEVFEKGLWGTEYRSPVGVDMPQSAASGNLTFDENVFNYVGLSIAAGAGGASVQIDKDNNGVFEEMVNLAEGESVYRDNVNTGGRILANRPVQVLFFSGTTSSTYGSRDTNLLPTYRWASEYYAPVTTTAGDGTVTFLYNPGATAITVNYDYRNSTSTYTTASVSVPAGGNARVVMSPAAGTTHYGAYRFYTTGTTPPVFYAMSAVDADAAAGGNTGWDGGFTLVGKPSLTTQILVSLGIGRDPYSSVNLSENGNPVWITTSGNGHTPATIYVDYNGDNAGSLTDPNGNKYDIAYSLRELQQQKVFDPDGDQSGMLIYSLDPTVRIAAAWAQDPSVASAAQPGIDVASLVPPLREGDAGKSSTVVVDADGDGYHSAGDTFEYDIRAVNNSRTNIPGPFNFQDTLPADTTYVPGTTRYRYTVGGVWQGWSSIPDDGTGTAFPLDGSGYSVPGNLPSGQQLQVTFNALVDTYVNLSSSSITNNGQVEISPYGLLLPVQWTDVLFGSISDLVWNDLDGDGVQDVGENGIAGVDVFIDTNNNGTWDSGEPIDTTDASGLYTLNGLLAGTYLVRVDPADIAAVNVGFGPSYDLDGVSTSHSASVTIAGAQDRTDADFGYRIGASVGNRVWVDRDADGTQEAGEPGINGVRVYIDLDNDNAYDVGEPNTITSGDGVYYIGNLNAGSYNVRVDTTTLPASITQTYDLNGGLDHEASVTLIAAEHRGDLDFGYRGTLSIGDLVWEDLNADGLVSVVSSTTYNVYNGRIDMDNDGDGDNNDDGFIGTMRIINGYVDIDNDNSNPVDTGDDGTFLGYTIVDGGVDINSSGTITNSDDGSVTYQVFESGIPNVRVYVDYNGNGTFDSTEPSAITNSSGIYTIGNMYNGTHTVRVDTTTLPSSYVQTYDLTSPMNDHRATVTLAGSSITNADFGYRNDASIGDLVWNDRNANGVRDAGEPGIEGVLVYLDADGDNVFDQATEIHDFTDVTGYYHIPNLPAGSYSVRIEISTLPQGSTQTYDLDGLGSPHEAARTLTISQDATDVDFGYRATASFGNFIWNDSDADGVQDGGELGIANVRVFADINGNGIFDSATEPSAVTDSAGAYTIGNLVPGTYTARVDTTTLPVGMIQTFDAVGALDHAATFFISASQARTDIDFGYTNPATIGNFVWNDTDADGTQDGGELGLGGVGITLFSAADDTIAGTTTSAADGSYSFSSVVPGTYYLVFDAVPGYSRTYADRGADSTDSDANVTTGRTANITLVGGGSNNTIDAGYYQPVSVGDFVFHDTNANGQQNGGEPGLAGVLVSLYRPGFGADGIAGNADDALAVTTYTTLAGGAYSFSGLPPGSYQLGFGNLSVYLRTLANIGSDASDSDANATTGLTTSYALAAGTTNNTIDAGYYIPGTISGHLYLDTNGDGDQDPGEPDLANVNVIVTDVNGNTQTVATNGSGNWTAIVPPGSTTADVDESDPQYPADSTQTEGDDPTTVVVVSNTTTSAGNDGYFIPAIVTGHLYEDTNGNGVQDGGESDLIEVDVLITDALGNTFTVTSDANGDWIAYVPPGSTTANVDETDPDFTNFILPGWEQTEGTDPTTVTAIAGSTVDGGIDGYFNPATVSGHLYRDTNGNGTQDPGEPDLAGVDVLITDVNGNTQTVATDANGDWSADVPPGSTTANVQESDPQFPSGATQTEGTDPTTVTAIAATDTFAGIDGYYVPATITGHLYRDTNGNGTQDPGEPDLPNVSLVITDSLGNTQNVATDANGDWTASVPPGSTTVNVNEADPDFTSMIPAGFVQTEGTDPSGVTAVAGVSTDAGNDGYFNPATVTGHLYRDTNGNGVQDGVEPNLANVDVVITDSLGNLQTVTTNASGNWSALVPPGSTSANVNELDPDFIALVPAGYIQTEGTDPTTVTAVAASSVSAGNDGYYNPATITGHLYLDTNGNGTQDGSEPDLANVDVLITDSLGNTQTVSTDANGDWTASVPPGSTIANVQETDPDFPPGVTQTEGTDPSTFTAVAASSVSGGIDGYFLPATVTGHLYIDANGNGTQDGSEPDLANVDVLVTDSLGNTQTVSTDANGDWTASVPPGSTTANVQETDPDFPAGVTQTEGTDPTTVTAIAGSSVNGGIDGYFPPATVTGHLYLDSNGNGTQDGSEPDLANVDVLITDSLGNTQTVSTDANGDWTASVPPGSTTANVDETDPDFPANVTQTEGTDPTTVTAIAATTVSGGIDGYFPPATVTGHLYLDTNGNGTQDGSEPDLANVDVLITDSLGNNQTVTTDSNGDWTASVPPGSTTANVQETDPDFPAGVTQTEGTDPTTVTAIAGSSVSGGIDGYFLPATVAGHLYLDTNGNGTQDGSEPDLANVDVLVTDSLGNNQTVTTDSNGDWTASVPPGSTTANVQEADPDFPAGVTQTEGTDPTTVTAIAGSSVNGGIDGYFNPATVTGHLYLDTNGNGTQDGSEPDLTNIDVLITDSLSNTQIVSTDANGDWTASVPPGSTTANVQETDPDFPAGVTQTEGTDPTTVTAIAGSSVNGGIDGYYLPATVTGHLYLDTNGNGTQDGSEPDLANVDVLITDSLGNNQTVTTDSNGDWTASVPPGSTTANVQEADPDFPAGVTQTEGTDPTSVTAIAGSSVDGGIDGYFLPATVTGHLYLDTNGNGTQDGSEPDLANVDVLVTDSLGNTQTVSTDANGDWTASVPPGSTTANVQETDPDFPAGVTQTEGTDPTTVTAIAGNSVNGGIDGYFNPATVTGHLYLDTNGNGTQDGSEPDLANVDVLITDSLSNTQIVSTDANGDWTASVPPGSTTANVQETDPDFPAGVTQTEGTDPTTVTAIAGSSVNGGIDGYFLPATVTGHLYLDTNGNGTQDGSEPDLANVDVLITDSLGNTQTVSTDANGDWTASVPPGSTTANVQETDPDFPAGVTQTEGTDPTTVTAIAGNSVNGGIDGYFLPATVTGHLYLDTNGNGTQDGSEPDLANVDVLVTDSLGNTQTVSTDANGDWTASVPPGSTTANVQETDPDFPAGVTQTEGTDPTTVTTIAGSSVNGGIDGYFLAATVTGHLYLDTNGNGTQDGSEPDLANVSVNITDSLGNIFSVTSNNDGDWSAAVPPGSTSANVDETDPDFLALVLAGYIQTEGTDPTVVSAIAGSTVDGGIDGYYNPATVTGHLYFDTNGNGSQDGSEPDLANIDVLITDSLGNTQTVSTDANGDWTASVPPGSTTANVQEIDPDFPANVVQTEGTDPTTVTAIAASTVSAGNDGYTPAPGVYAITGQVRDDFDLDGSFSDNDTPVSGVMINLYRDVNQNGQLDPGDALLATTTTGANGEYAFTGLADGYYIVEEDDPNPSSSTADVVGANDNIIPVTIAGANVTGRDFLDAVDPHGYFYDTETGEIIPGGSISVSGPGTIIIAQNGTSGQYSWLADTTGVVYTMTVNVPAGYTLDPSRPALAGPYNPTSVPNPNVLGSGENPSAPGTLTDFSAPSNPWYLTFIFDPGDPLIINNNIPLLKNKPLTYTGWRSRHPLGGQNDPDEDPDGDDYDNIQEFAFCYPPDSGTNPNCPVTITVQSDGRVDLNVRRVIGITGVSYIPEFITALASSGPNGAGWTDMTTIVPVVTNLGNGKEIATYQGVNTLPPLVGAAQGFFRVRLELDSDGDTVVDAVSRTKTAGYTLRSVASMCETFSMPYFGCPPAAGVIDVVSGSLLDSTTSMGIGNIANSLTSGRQYYIEITSGDHEGHRFELDEANSTATMLAVDVASPLNTMASLPATLAGDHWSIRPHHTFNDLFPPARFSGASNSPTDADRISLKSGAGFTFYWLYLNGGSPIWVSAAEATLEDRGNTILPPGVGAYVRPRSGSVTLHLSGFVRSNDFARPLAADTPFVGGGWPMDQSPNSRAMTTASNFTANRSSTVADRLIFWKGDTVPNAQGYDTYSYLSYSSNLYWISMEDATLNSMSDQNLLRSTRAGFIKVSTPLPNYLMPLPWTP